MDEIQKAKTRYYQAIEDGRKVEVFTSMPEWQWFVEKVINPTIAEYTNRILTGVVPTDKEDWILRGMIAGMKLIVDTTDSFKTGAVNAKKKAEELKNYVGD